MHEHIASDTPLENSSIHGTVKAQTSFEPHRNKVQIYAIIIPWDPPCDGAFGASQDELRLWVDSLSSLDKLNVPLHDNVADRLLYPMSRCQATQSDKRECKELRILVTTPETNL